MLLNLRKSGAAPFVFPSLQGVLATTCLDIDVTSALCFAGVGTTLANLISFPADGAAQTDYDFHLGTSGAADGSLPTFSGSGASAKLAFSGAQWCTQKVNTTLVKNLHKTTGGTAHTLFIAGKFTSRGVARVGQALYGTGGRNAAKHGTAVGNGFYGTANNYQRNCSGAAFVDTDAQGGTDFADGTFKVLAFTFDPSTRATKAYINSATPYTSSVPTYSSTTDCSDLLQIGAGGAADSPIYSGAEIKAWALASGVIADADFTNVKALYNTRHSNIY